MYSVVNTALLEGIGTVPVQVEIDVSNGLPMFDMVGYLGSEVREAKERVRTALHNCGIIIPAKRITMNLSPANIRKTGTGFDLPIAVGLLIALGIIGEEVCRDFLFAGELGLNGSILPIPGVLPIVSDGMEREIRKFIVPRENQNEGRLVAGAEVYGFSNIGEMIHFLDTGEYTDIPAGTAGGESADTAGKTLDFAEVNGQKLLKRACEVAAAGMHNLLMIGPPGGGKTMISERMKTILPPLTEAEQLELSKIYSVCGLLDSDRALMSERPFRNPHHTITRAGLTGGGAVPKPGEISLAHKGVLFLDELPEFQKNTLEILRQPMEEHRIHLTRAGISISYPADFLLLAAMNPCNCGYYPDRQKCRCTDAAIKRYLAQISQPLIDRIDICVQSEALSYQELTGTNGGESSEIIRERVCRCHQIQYERFRNENFLHNSRIPASRMKEYCRLGDREQHFMEGMYEKMAMTGRTYHKILRVARTIADLDESPRICMRHLNEALCYRSIDQNYWGGMS